MPVSVPLFVIVARLVFEETQGLDAAGEPDPVRVKVEPTQTKLFPVIVQG